MARRGARQSALAGAACARECLYFLIELLWQGVGGRDMLGTASLLSAPLTLVVAIAALGLELGAVTPEGKSTLIVLAVASGTLFPILFHALAPRPTAGSPPAD
jgi:Kef-type K+ transport system membrane component KefB